MIPREWKKVRAAVILRYHVYGRVDEEGSGSGGSFVELAPDRFFNLQPLATVLVGERDIPRP